MSYETRYVFVGDPALALLGEGSYGKVYKAKDKQEAEEIPDSKSLFDKMKRNARG